MRTDGGWLLGDRTLDIRRRVLPATCAHRTAEGITVIEHGRRLFSRAVDPLTRPANPGKEPSQSSVRALTGDTCVGRVFCGTGSL